MSKPIEYLKMKQYTWTWRGIRDYGTLGFSTGFSKSQGQIIDRIADSFWASWRASVKEMPNKVYLYYPLGENTFGISRAMIGDTDTSGRPVINIHTIALNDNDFAKISFNPFELIRYDELPSREQPNMEPLFENHTLSNATFDEKRVSIPLAQMPFSKDNRYTNTIKDILQMRTWEIGPMVIDTNEDYTKGLEMLFSELSPDERQKCFFATAWGKQNEAKRPVDLIKIFPVIGTRRSPEALTQEDCFSSGSEDKTVVALSSRHVLETEKAPSKLTQAREEERGYLNRLVGKIKNIKTIRFGSGPQKQGVIHTDAQNRQYVVAKSGRQCAECHSRSVVGIESLVVDENYSDIGRDLSNSPYPVLIKVFFCLSCDFQQLDVNRKDTL